MATKKAATVDFGEWTYREVDDSFNVVHPNNDFFCVNSYDDIAKVISDIEAREA